MEPSQSRNNKTYLCYQNSLSDDYELVDSGDDNDEEESPKRETNPIQHGDVWSEIPLNSGMTASNSTTSSNYSQNTDCEETLKNDEAETSNENNNKDSNKDDDKKSGGLSEWLSKSSFRRQSLEDVFAQSTLFGKFSRSGERRNSESEVESSSTSSAKKEFFLFGRTEGLTDSQIDHLFLPDEHL